MIRSARPIVWFSIFDWWTSSHGHSDFQLALRLARKRPVLFVNSIGMRIPKLGQTSKVGKRILRKLASAVHGLSNPLPELPLFSVLTLAAPPVLEGFALHAAAFQLRMAMYRRSIEAPAVIVTIPSALPLAEKIARGQLIYYRSDNHGAFFEAPPYIMRCEKRLLAEAKVVAYSSKTLMQDEFHLVGGKAIYLEHGVDPALFHPGVTPDPEILNLPAPRMGFLGSLRGHAVDFDLLGSLAEAMPNASVILMGDQPDHLGALKQHKNIHILPGRAHHEMPQCWAALSVAILPYKRTPWTDAIDPIKLREILAVGLPIAATAIPAACAYGARIEIADFPADFPHAVRSALSRCEPLPVPRIPSWDKQCESFEIELC